MFRLSSFKFNTLGGSHKNLSKDTWHYSALRDCADGIWDWDLIKGELYISPNLRELVGYEEANVVNRPSSWWLEQIHPDDREEISRKIEEVLQSGSEFIYFDPFRFLCPNGQFIWLENHAKILRDKNGKLIRLAGITTNTNLQKLIQNQLRTIIIEQEKEAQNKMRFLSALNHEFRSPLSGVIGMTTLLKDTNLSEEQLHFVDNITNSTEMLLTLVNDILDVTKLNSGKFQFENISFSPSEVIKRASDLIRPSLVKKDLSFNTLIDKEVPLQLMGDPTRLQQILVNLLSNATKFTSKGQITLLVKAIPSAKSQGMSLLNFEISDTGIGIAPEVLNTLFEDFTQADTSITRIFGGTGLGLFICKELVHLMGGQIGVKSELGKGSTFWFSIPFNVQDAGQTTESNPKLTSTEHPRQDALKVLLVEDNQVNQEVMSGLLSLLGDDVTIANNGEEAVKIFQTKEFDIVLMDLNLPILDGLSATQAIRKLPNGNIPIIAVTANTFTANEEICLSYGILHVLNKPINKVTLEQALQPYRSQTNTNVKIEKNEILQNSPHPVVDQKALKTLIQDLGKEKVLRLLDIYRNDALTLVNQIKSSSPEDSKTHAHTLAGMSENLGIQLVGKTARDIMGASQDAPENLPILIQDLERQFATTLTEIQDIVLSSSMVDHD